MRIVFVGRENFQNHCFANWLSGEHEVCAYFRADSERYTMRYRYKWLRRRIRKVGLLRALDELLYQFYHRLFLYRINQLLMREAFGSIFGTEFFNLPDTLPYYEFDDLNSTAALSVLKKINPDVVFAVCISQYLCDKYMIIPKFGTLLYHEGLTPEYKGLHTAFWANYNHESHMIGYTLMRMNEKLDGGQVLAQGLGKIDPALAHWWGYAGHKALIDGLPDVSRALKSLEQGVFPRITREHGRPRIYSYPGISDEFRRALGTRAVSRRRSVK